MGKRGILNQKANKILKDKFLHANITTCEACGSDFGLTFAHRLKRRHMSTLEELTDIQNVLLLCLKCHMSIEYDKDKTDKLFTQCRPLKEL